MNGSLLVSICRHPGGGWQYLITLPDGRQFSGDSATPEDAAFECARRSGWEVPPDLSEWRRGPGSSRFWERSGTVTA